MVLRLCFVFDSITNCLGEEFCLLETMCQLKFLINCDYICRGCQSLGFYTNNWQNQKWKGCNLLNKLLVAVGFKVLYIMGSIQVNEKNRISEDGQ